jgi:hypothetical protein
MFPSKTGMLAGFSGDSIRIDWNPIRRWRRRLLMPLFRLADTAIPGLTPLRTHLLICGFPRAGTTLLQMMLENAMPYARRFGREVGGWRAATYCWRNHPVVISKVPHDLFRLDELRDFYSRRQAKLKIILMLRDPRDVLTSQRKMSGRDREEYVVGFARWRKYYQHFRMQWDRCDSLLVRYEKLVTEVETEQKRIETFTGEPTVVSFRSFHEVPRSDFDISTLNGLRPVENSLLCRWKQPRHRERIAAALREIPELPRALRELHYESDESWIEQWKNGQ